ncbi:MAG: glucose-1-phosphate adenylyltransferase [Halanaerobiales bacterium]
MSKKEIVAMLLAGGKGTRLGVLTNNLAKPAVPFGAEFRLIDFPLSNCSNSGINTVGILTQYEPLVLNSYIGNGSSWELDRNDGGVTVLPPYLHDKGVSWYKGTADAVYHNINYIDRYSPDYVLILSGDHVYKMDYSKMLEFHKEKDAAASIAVIEVPWEETHRFGIMNTDDINKIIEFQEKPDEAKSNLASMGIYIFDWPLLKDYLIEDSKNPDSSGDFGHDIIPALMNDQLEVYAYKFDGYWMDVGTIDSYWKAHMDLIHKDSGLDLYDRSWIISSLNPNQPPLSISKNADVDHSLINKGSKIEGTVKNSVIFFGSSIGENSIVEDSVILPNTKIGEGCHIKKSIICHDVQIKDNCNVGADDLINPDITVVADNMTLSRGTNIKNGSVVE